MSHRVRVPDAPPPLAPTLPPVLQFEDLHGALQALAQYQRMLNVWLQQQLGPVRQQLAWLLNQIGSRNLCPDSDLKDVATYWTLDPQWVATDAVGWGGGRGFVLAASAAGTFAARSVAVPVIPGDVYVLSGWIDASGVTAGSVALRLWNAADNGVVATVAQPAGESERVEQPVTMPAGVTSVYVGVVAIDPVLSAPIVASQLQLELPQQGHLGTTTEPAASLYRQNIGADT